MLRRTILGLEIEIPDPTVTDSEAPDGLEHVDDTLSRMAALAFEAAEDWRIRELAIRALRRRGVKWKDKRGEIGALYDSVVEHVDYRNDPLHVEWLQRPIYTLVSGAGDCDDIATVLASLFAAVGIPYRFRTVGATEALQEHVHVEALAAEEPDGWVSVDPVLIPEGGRLGARAPGSARLYAPHGGYVGVGGRQDDGSHPLWYAGDPASLTLPSPGPGAPPTLWEQGQAPAFEPGAQRYPVEPPPSPESCGPPRSLWTDGQVRAFRPVALPPQLPAPAPGPAQPPTALEAVGAGVVVPMPGGLGATPGAAVVDPVRTELPDLSYDRPFEEVEGPWGLLEGVPVELARREITRAWRQRGGRWDRLAIPPIVSPLSSRDGLPRGNFRGSARLLEDGARDADTVCRLFRADVWDESRANLGALLRAAPQPLSRQWPTEVIEASIAYQVDWCVAIANNVARCKHALNCADVTFALDDPIWESLRSNPPPGFGADDFAPPGERTVYQYQDPRVDRPHSLMPWIRVWDPQRDLWGGDYWIHDAEDIVRRGGPLEPMTNAAAVRSLWQREQRGAWQTIEILRRYASRYSVTPFTSALNQCIANWYAHNFGFPAENAEAYAEALDEHITFSGYNATATYVDVYVPPATRPSLVPHVLEGFNDDSRAIAREAVMGAQAELESAWADWMTREPPSYGELTAVEDRGLAEQHQSLEQLDGVLADAQAAVSEVASAGAATAEATAAAQASLDWAGGSLHGDGAADAVGEIVSVLGWVDDVLEDVSVRGLLDTAASAAIDEIDRRVGAAFEKLAVQAVESIAQTVVSVGVTVALTAVGSVVGTVIGALISNLLGAFFGASGPRGIRLRQHAITSPFCRWANADGMRAEVLHNTTRRSLYDLFELLNHMDAVFGGLDVGTGKNSTLEAGCVPPSVVRGIGVPVEVVEVEEEPMTRHDPHPEVGATYPEDARQLYDSGADVYRVYLPSAEQQTMAQFLSPEALQAAAARSAGLLGCPPRAPNPVSVTFGMGGMGQQIGANGLEAAARQAADEIEARGYNYDRTIVEDFQAGVGLSPDGLYGPATRDAVAYYAGAAPPALFAGGSETFVPPQEGGATPPPPGAGAPSVDGYHHVGDESVNPGLPPIPADGAAPGGVEPPPAPGGEPVPAPSPPAPPPEAPPSGGPVEPPPGGVPTPPPGNGRPARGIMGCPGWVWLVILYLYSQRRR